VFFKGFALDRIDVGEIALHVRTWRQRAAHGAAA
jgi:hypothetical protein